jgi:RimJ/RimL family protein N-acetyltransferase
MSSVSSLRPASGAAKPSLASRISLRHAGLTLTEVTVADNDFLSTLMRDECGDAYDRARPSRELLDKLLDSQRRSEVDRIARRYVGSEFLVIRRGGQPIGRLTIAPEVTEFGSCLRIADMAMLRYHQSRGYGRGILCDVIDGARRMGFYRVNVRVFAANDVFVRLLKSIGFRVSGTLDPTSHIHLFCPLR